MYSLISSTELGEKKAGSANRLKERQCVLDPSITLHDLRIHPDAIQSGQCQNSIDPEFNIKRTQCIEPQTDDLIVDIVSVIRLYPPVLHE